MRGDGVGAYADDVAAPAYTVEDVVAQSVAAAQAGAAVIHLHARDPKDGSPTADPAVFLEYLKAIKAETDAVISITSGGGTGMSVTDRLRVIYETKPELCTLNLGTFNYGSFPMIGKYAGKWKFDWEEPYLESTRSEPFVSTFADIEHMLTRLRRRPAAASSTRPTTSATSTRWPTTISSAWWSRRSSCRRSWA